MNIHIRRAVPTDAEGINRVLYTTWLSTYVSDTHGISIDDIEDQFKDKFSSEGILKSQERLQSLPDTVHVFVATDEEKVVAVCRLILRDEENFLQTLYVLPDYQGQGIGTRMWNVLLGIIDPRKETKLVVATYNQKAISFYERIGFSDTGKRTNNPHIMRSGSSIPEMEMCLPARG